MIDLINQSSAFELNDHGSGLRCINIIIKSENASPNEAALSE
jgi:hypothetical protein